MSNLSWLNPTPHATAVYASCSALLPPHATLASRRPATALPGPDSHRLIAPALAGAFFLDHLIGELLEMQRYVETDRLGCLEIDDKFELKRSLHWKLGWLFALENAIHIRRRTSKIIGPVNAIGQKT